MRFYEHSLGHRLTNRSAFYVWGANTNVGKTWLSSFLTLGALSQGHDVCYLKPFQTGFLTDCDAGRVVDTARRNLVSPESARLFASTHSAWLQAVGPHRAREDEGGVHQQQGALRWLVRSVNQQSSRWLTLIEGAGGVLSPGPQGEPQADVFRCLRLPVVLVADTSLGGIGATLGAYEALITRGYEVLAVVGIEQNDLKNSEALQHCISCSKHKMPLFVTITESFAALHEPLSPQLRDRAAEVVRMLWNENKNRQLCLEELNKPVEKSPLWWPFTQHSQVKTPRVIDSAYGDSFVRQEQQGELVTEGDASASWWTQGFGHGDAHGARHVAAALGRYGHVLFPHQVHQPAFDLARVLLNGVGRGWAHKVFYSDNGSTAVEVALKMAFKLRRVRCKKKDYNQAASVGDLSQKLAVVAMADGYHGDTLGAMDACAPSVFNAQEEWYQGRGFWFHGPQIYDRHGEWRVHFSDDFLNQVATVVGRDSVFFAGDVIVGQRHKLFDYESSGRPALALAYEDFIERQFSLWSRRSPLGAVLLEPLVLGSGGMVGIDPLFQRSLVIVAQRLQIPVIFDEVFSGFWRLGVESARLLLGVDPDIACYSKLLTGGLLPLAVTLATQEVFDCFWGQEKSDALLHGHSYTAHPAGCAAALYALSSYDEWAEQRGAKPGMIVDLWNEKKLVDIEKNKSISRVFYLGSVLALALQKTGAGHEKFFGEGGQDPGFSYNSSLAEGLVARLLKAGVHCRPLGNVVYFMSPFVVKSSKNEEIMRLINRALHE